MTLVNQLVSSLLRAKGNREVKVENVCLIGGLNNGVPAENKLTPVLLKKKRGP